MVWCFNLFFLCWGVSSCVGTQFPAQSTPDVVLWSLSRSQEKKPPTQFTTLWPSSHSPPPLSTSQMPLSPPPRNASWCPTSLPPLRRTSQGGRRGRPSVPIGWAAWTWRPWWWQTGRCWRNTAETTSPLMSSLSWTWWGQCFLYWEQQD